MIRGTTPRLEFTLPFEASLLAEAWITISQNRKEVFTKELKDCECNGEMLILDLTQDETLRLGCEYVAELQIRAKTYTGEVIASDIIQLNAERILKDGVI